MNKQAEELYDYWFSNPNIWFNCGKEIDEYITDKYKDNFLEIEKFMINIEDKICNKKYSIGLIILYDQIVRHILRVTNDDNKYDIVYYNLLALRLSEKVYDFHKDNLNADEFAFVMLPYRHTKICKNIFYVIKETWNKIDSNKNNEFENAKYKKFLKATYENYITKSNDIDNLSIYDKNLSNNNSMNIEYFRDILDVKCLKNIDEQNDFSISNIFIESLKSIEKDHNIYPLILSISGGVDSMICSNILKRANIPFICVHINYNNRNESIKEEEFVINWCKHIGVKLFVRRIEEINRPKCKEYNLRELYEDYTRDIRFGSYINSVNRIDNINVILGHNNDDCFENIITNISHKNKYNNLLGMDNITKINHNDKVINFLRPMLDIKKEDIYKYANNNYIPYLCDSTPKWSQRGKIRDLIRPTLLHFNKNIVDGLFEVSNMLKESLELVDTLVDTWFNKIINNDKNKSIDKKSDMYNICMKRIYTVYNIELSVDKLIVSKIFWKKMFEKLEIKVSSKSLDEYINKINKIKGKFNDMKINVLEKYQINVNKQIKFIKNKMDNLIIEF